MKLIVGLGNPGDKYSKNRHNAGFLVLDQIVSRVGGSWQGRKFDADIARLPVCGTDSLLLKPQTFMNLSGRSVVQAQRFYKIAIDDVIVLHDDIDVPFGKVKARTGGGHGGHNGIRSIIADSGVETFGRVKLGVGRPHGVGDVANWVLGNFTLDELIQVETEMVNEALIRLEGLIRNPG